MRREKATSIATLLVIGLGALLIACATSRTQPTANAQPNQPATTEPQANPAAGNLPLRVLSDVPLTGGTARFDYQSLDSSSGRLFAACEDNSKLVVFDLEQRKQRQLFPSERIRTCLL